MFDQVIHEQKNNQINHAHQFKLILFNYSTVHFFLLKYTNFSQHAKKNCLKLYCAYVICVEMNMKSMISVQVSGLMPRAIFTGQMKLTKQKRKKRKPKMNELRILFDDVTQAHCCADDKTSNTNKTNHNIFD